MNLNRSNTFFVFHLTKIEEGLIDVPILPEDLNYKSGIYFLVYKGTVVKVGLFGKGVGSNAMSRFNNYRSMGKNYLKYLDNKKAQNGSYLTIKALSDNLNIGEQVEVYFVPYSIEQKEIDGIPIMVDLPTIEDKFKSKCKDTLWLN